MNKRARLRNRVREIRELRVMTQEELARASGVGVATISRYERQLVKQYDGDVLIALGKALEWEATQLLFVSTTKN